MLHYVRHFPEDSLGSENREDVGKRWGGSGLRGCARGRANKYLTKSSGKLIPSFGRLLRGAPSSAAPSTRSSGSVLLYSAIFLVRFRVRIGEESRPDGTVWRASKILEYYQQPGILLAFILIPAVSCRFATDFNWRRVCYISSRAETRDCRTDKVMISYPEKKTRLSGIFL